MEGESEDRDLLDKRKEQAIGLLKKKKVWIIYIVLAVIAYLGYFLRTRNLGYLTDITTGKYIPLALDPFAFLKYVEYIFENGSLMVTDVMRYVPWGYSSMNEFSFLSHFIVYMYKIWHLFVPSVTIQYVHIMYPVVCFVIGLVFFYFFVREIFDWRVALLSSGFLAVLPAFLYRTMAGFADKEAAAIMFMFMALFFYVLMVKRKSIKAKLIGAIAGGITLGLMTIIWGGARFIFLTVGCYIILMVLMNRFSKKDLLYNAIFLFVVTLVAMIGYPDRFSLGALLFSVTTGILYGALFFAFVNYLLFDVLKVQKFWKTKIPNSIVAAIAVVVIAIIFLMISEGPMFLFDKLSGIFVQLTNPFGTTRWGLTVAEAHQPYFVDWVANFTWNFLILFYLGSIFLFYELVKKLKNKYVLTGLYAIFILLFSMNRYSSSSILNGVSGFSVFVYIGSLVGFIALMAYFFFDSYYKDRDNFLEILKLNKLFIFILLFFLFMILGARSAVRLLFLFAPITAILGSYALIFVADKAKYFKDNIYKYGLVLVVVVLSIFLLFTFYSSTLVQSKYTGPSYNQQWQLGMEWVRENTDESAVFAHWWDYGYWVQYGGERATLADGGNAMGDLNHYLGRFIMLAENETEMMEYVQARGATHLLYISDEIGKYGAYSSIGSDANYDRYSWIPNFGLDLSQTQETRNNTLLAYTGGTYLDEDLIFGDQIFPAGSAAVAGFIVPANTDDAGGIIDFEQPTAILTYQGQQLQVPLRCINVGGETIIFNEIAGDYLESCLVIIPAYSGEEYNAIGSSLYLSPRVSRGSFAQLYLLNNEAAYPHLELVYNDEASMPLSVYNGQLIGPLKIWEYDYIEGLEIPAHYYETELIDPSVTEV
jgi:asparagine N-glycosylation enzyme membrane subunit Stt3